MPNLTIRYVVVLGIIALVVSGSYFLAQKEMKAQLNDSRIVNLSGRQRMLSQKISKSSLEILQTTNRTEKEIYKKELEEAAALWEKSHSDLQKEAGEFGLSLESSKAIEEFFATIEPKRQVMQEAAGSIIRELELKGNDANVADFVTTILSNEAAYLSGMNEIVFQYEKEARAHIERSGNLELVFLLVILITMVSGGVFIMRPGVKKLKQIDKAKSEFVSLASHQLRTPLSTVNWYAEMLLAGDAGKLNDEQKKYIEKAYKGNQRMIKLVNSLLNVSRLELGTFVIETEPTDIVKLARSVIDEQKSKSDAKKIKITPHLSKGMPSIQADPNLLRMVFQNLLSNSIKFTPENGKIEFEISSGSKDIKIRVSDTGLGIPKNQHDKIFTKFFRADNVKEQDTDSTGLGLYIVKSIVEHSGGKIWFESEENKGTTFFVTLPLKGMEKKEGSKTLS